MMKTRIILTLVIGLSALTTFAQGRPGGPGGPPGGGNPPVDPLMTTLDANTSGVIESAEISSASAALLKLDKDSNGKLTDDELRPQRPAGGNQPEFTPPSDGKRPLPPLLSAVDTSGNGELEATEISNASTALKKLDTNGDGQLTRDEIMPKRSDEPRGTDAAPPAESR